MRPPLALIIEDEYLIASDVAGGLGQAGFEVACVASERAADLWLDEHLPDVAIVDIKLSDDRRGAAASRLKRLGVPFIVHSGYEPAYQASIFHGAPFMTKPAETDALVDLAKQLTPPGLLP